MRIVSLVPHATELLFALGLGDDVVAVTHECDLPAKRPRSLPQITRDVLPAGLSAGEIDAAVRERTERGEAIYELDARAPARARARPHRHPGAVPGVRRQRRRRARGGRARSPAGRRSSPWTRTRSGESFGDVRTIAQLTDSREAALDLIARQRARVDAVRLAVRKAERVPGGRDRVVRPGLRRRPLDAADHRPRRRHRRARLRRASTPSRAPGRPSPPRRRAWSSPCPAATTPSARTPRPAPTPTRCATVGAERVVAVDASAYFSRPGPRLVDGLELMAHILHPDLVPEPVGRGLSRSRSERGRQPAAASAPTTAMTDSTTQPT